MKNLSRKSSILTILIVALASLLGVPGGVAKTFRSKFVTLELPPNWDCQQEELDWVCQPENPNLRNEAIVVIVTKAVNPTDDTMDKYKEYLRQPRQMRDLLGNSYTTEIKYVKDKKIGDQMWVDSLQIGAEIPGFISRYVASIKEQVAALISYHVAESVFPKWAEILDKMIDSAELRFDPKAFDGMNKTQNISIFGAKTPQNLSAKGNKVEKPADTGEDNTELYTKIAGAVLILGVIIGYIIYKKKKGSIG